MTARTREIAVGGAAGFAVTLAGVLLATFVGGWAAWLGWSPVVVSAAAFGFFARQERSGWGTGLFAGVGAALIVGAGICSSRLSG